MYFSSMLSVFVASWSATLAAAETIVIKAENVYFEPANVNASAGDILEFHFGPNNHSVVMGDLANPCEPISTGGFYSGFLPASNGENSQVFQVTINDTNPIVYYCSQNASAHNHCKDGMIGFVNQPNESDMTTYTSAATGSTSNVSPDGGPFGGSLVANANASTAANSTVTSGSPTQTPTGSAGPSGSATDAPLNDNSGAVAAGSGLLAAVMALMAI